MSNEPASAGLRFALESSQSTCERGLTRAAYLRLVLGSAAILLACLTLAPLIGPTSLDLRAALSDPSSLDFEILTRARLPRVLFAALTGAALAASGLVFQALLRNPLASPFTLGVSGGGSLGAVIAISLGWEVTWLGLSLLPVASFAGSLAVVILVYGLSRTGSRFSPLTLLLAGVVLNYLCAALILLLHFFSDFTQSFRMMRWMMGGLDIYDYGVIISVSPFLITGTVVLLSLSRSLNALSAGTDWAASRGVRVNRTLTLLYFGASLMTGAVVAYSGPVGFVGLIVPHTLRLMLGPDHRKLLPCSLLLGGSFVVVCDTIARTVLAPTEIPVGIFTALLGGPFFLWLLVSRRQTLFG